MLNEEYKSRLAELENLAQWLQATEMCAEDKLLLKYHILNRVKILTTSRDTTDEMIMNIFRKK